MPVQVLTICHILIVYCIVILYESAGKSDQAVKVLTDAITLSNDSRLFVERAEISISGKAYSDAIGDLNAANKITPYSGEYGLGAISGVVPSFVARMWIDKSLKK